MNVAKIWLIIVLMSAALIGIILVQAYWVHNAITLRKTIFNQQVNEALHATVDHMERHRTARLIDEHVNLQALEELAFITIDSSVMEQSLADTLVEELLSTGEPLAVGETLRPRYTESQTAPASSSPRIMPTDPFGIGSAVFEDAPADDAQMLPALLLNVEQQIMTNIQRFNSVIDQVLVELVRGQYGPTRSLDPDLLDSLLSDELGQKGIYTPYTFGVLIGQEKLLTTAGDEKEKTELLASVHRVSMSPGNLFTRPDELYVNFPQENQYVLNSLWTLLSGSALFTLVIILGFSYTVHALFRQKKLTDIKTDFINNMTHEFKTPIATISLAVDSINNPRIISDQQRIAQYTGIIREENKRMNAQVEKVLQMALLDRNEVKLNRDLIDMHQVIHTAVEGMNIQVENKGGRISSELGAIKTQVSGDEVHLINVVQNLLDNANKYTPDQPLIRVETWNDKRGIYISIADNGIGMDRETQRRIFEKFYRLPKGNVHDVKGFGLGLSYVKAILDAHEGSITVKSQLKEGSRFIIYLPNVA